MDLAYRFMDNTHILKNIYLFLGVLMLLISYTIIFNKKIDSLSNPIYRYILAILCGTTLGSITLILIGIVYLMVILILSSIYAFFSGITNPFSKSTVNICNFIMDLLYNTFKVPKPNLEINKLSYTLLKMTLLWAGIPYAFRFIVFTIEKIFKDSIGEIISIILSIFSINFFRACIYTFAFFLYILCFIGNVDSTSEYVAIRESLLAYIIIDVVISMLYTSIIQRINNKRKIFLTKLLLEIQLQKNTLITYQRLNSDFCMSRLKINVIDTLIKQQESKRKVTKKVNTHHRRTLEINEVELRRERYCTYIQKYIKQWKISRIVIDLLWRADLNIENEKTSIAKGYSPSKKSNNMLLNNLYEVEEYITNELNKLM